MVKKLFDTKQVGMPFLIVRMHSSQCTAYLNVFCMCYLVRVAVAGAVYNTHVIQNNLGTTWQLCYQVGKKHNISGIYYCHVTHPFYLTILVIDTSILLLSHIIQMAITS